LVALISKLKGGKRRGRKAHANGKANGLTLENLLAAKGLVARVGSVEVAKSALDSFAELVEA
jgi:hypothetical protein